MLDESTSRVQLKIGTEDECCLEPLVDKALDVILLPSEDIYEADQMAKTFRLIGLINNLARALRIALAGLLALSLCTTAVADDSGMNVPAPDFTLPVIANGDGSLVMGDLEGSVVTSTFGPPGVVPVDYRCRHLMPSIRNCRIRVWLSLRLRSMLLKKMLSTFSSDTL